MKVQLDFQVPKPNKFIEIEPPREVKVIFAMEAERRGLGVNQLAELVISVICQDKLFLAVLEE